MILRVYTLILFVCALLLSPTARADAPAAPPAPAPKPAAAETDLEHTLDDVVVISAKRPQPVRETAANTSVITAADLALYGWRDFTEAIAALTGFYTSNPGDYTYVGVRGLSLKGDVSGRLLVLIDGHMQNELWSHSLYPEQLGLDAAMIDHIEVLRGPASSLYGSLGFLAIINIVTRIPTEGHFARATFDMRSIDGFRGVASVDHRFRSGLSFSLQLSAQGGLGRANTYPDIDPAAEPWRFATNTSRREVDTSLGLAAYGKLEYKGFWLKASYQYLDKRIPYAPYLTVFNDPTNRFTTSRGYVDAGYEFGRPETLQFTARGYFDFATYHDSLRIREQGTEPYTFRDDAAPFWAGLELKLLRVQEWRDILRATFTLGGEFTFLRGNQESGDAAKPDEASTLSADIFRGSVYGQAELTFVRKIGITLGLRGDFASHSSSEMSPRVGVVFFPWRTGTFKLLYSHGFIHPSWYARFFDDGTSIFRPDRLDPERADNYEFIYQQEIIRPLTLTLAAFSIHVENMIELVGCQDAAAPPSACRPGGQVFQNAAAFTSRGAEIGLVGRFARGLRFYANYSLAFAVDDRDGQPAFNSPRHLVKGGLAVPLWREHLVLGAEARFDSGRRLSTNAMDGSPQFTDPSVRLSAHILWKDLPKGFSAMVKVYDFTGLTFYEPSVAEQSDPISRIPLPGLSVVGRLSYEY